MLLRADFSQLFARLESRHPACGDFDFFARLRVAAFSRGALANFKVSKSDQLHFFAVLQRLGNCIEDGIYGFRNIFFGQIRRFRHFGNQFRFVHAIHLPPGINAVTFCVHRFFENYTSK
jgi:hypothetical protein